MTIAEKSTELGIDLTQIALDKYGVAKCKVNDNFHCFTIKAGEKSNIYISDENEEVIHNGYFRWSDDALAEGSTLSEVETAFKSYLDAQEFIAVNSSVVVYEDLV